MAGFRQDEKRSADGRWTYDNSISPASNAHSYFGLHTLEKKAHTAVAERMRAEQLGEAFQPPIGKFKRAIGQGVVAAHKIANVAEKVSNKVYGLPVVGPALTWLGKDRFTRAIPPGSKRDAAVRGIAALTGLALSGGLKALSPTWTANKALRAADWGIKSHQFKAAQKAARTAKSK